jgi:hypothetical protein
MLWFGLVFFTLLAVGIVLIFWLASPGRIP